MFKFTLALLIKTWYDSIELKKERSVRTYMMFENFMGFDVDDMIFGTTEQIVSER